MVVAVSLGLSWWKRAAVAVAVGVAVAVAAAVAGRLVAVGSRSR